MMSIIYPSRRGVRSCSERAFGQVRRSGVIRRGRQFRSSCITLPLTTLRDLCSGLRVYLPRTGVDRHAHDVVKGSNWSLEAYGLVSCSRPPATRMQAWRGMPPAFCRCVSHCVMCPLAGFICHGIVLRQSTFWCHWQLLLIVTVSKTELRKISSAGSVSHV